MKKLALTLVILFCGFNAAFAQTPEGFNYQVALRDGSGAILASQSVGIRISILQGSASGANVYVEIFQRTTSTIGLVNLIIGQGDVISGNFSLIDWSVDKYFIELAIDATGGTNYIVMGTSQLMSVPFAMHSQNAENATNSVNAEHALIADSAENAINSVNAEHALIAANVFSGDYNDLVNKPPVTIVLSGGNINCNGSTEGFVNSTVSGGASPYTYLWSNGATTEYISELIAGTYSLVVTDNAGNTSSNSIVITENEELAVSVTKNDPTCFEGTNGQINLIVSGGKQPYSFEWSNGSFTQNQTNLVAGVYSVKVIDANNCFINKEIELSSPTELIVTESLTHVDCYGSSTGSIALTVSGGEAPFTYSWSNGSTTKDITDLVAGVYSVTITETGNCTSLYEYTINSNTEIVLTNEQVSPSCTIPSNGSIAVEIEGGADPTYTYLWSNGSVTKDISNVAAGAYDLTVTDIVGCSKVFSFTVSSNADFTLGATIIDEANSASDGSITLAPVGGLAPYDYSWSTGPTTPEIQNINAGNYDANVYDANGCFTSESYTINNVTSATDFDGNSYNVVKIGDQIWTRENLKTTHNNDGWEIIGLATVKDDVLTYGYRYNHSILGAGNVCPIDWHVPTLDDWEQLIVELNGYSYAGGMLKEAGTAHWTPYNIATNQSGFTALPHSWLSTSYGYYMSSEPSAIFELTGGSASIKLLTSSGYGYVRCIKD